MYPGLSWGPGTLSSMTVFVITPSCKGGVHQGRGPQYGRAEGSPHYAFVRFGQPNEGGENSRENGDFGGDVIPVWSVGRMEPTL